MRNGNERDTAAGAVDRAGDGAVGGAASGAARTAGGGAGGGAATGAAGAPGSAQGVPRDTVAAVVRQWQAVRPDIDTGPMEVIGRINRCAALLQQAEDAPLRRVGLTRPEFDLLGALRRTGHELTPSELARETFSSGAAVTKRLKQLQERDLVARRADTRDRRVSHVSLTGTGRDLVDSLLPDQLAYETVVLAGLDADGQGQLSGLLGELLSQLEGRLGLSPGFRG
ncbi:MarR family winged helix-turn-helix transcriptional regulator [Streptomyces sp. NPDC055243]|uniref:MarR family winged helix-turn-helix transcriptional regulator n=1 Tax=Streptomyces sp. NPDC055243 TaxID=3365720 RepID=UPI0037D0FD3A